MHAQNFRLHSAKWHLVATSRKKIVQASAQDELSGSEAVVKKRTPLTTKRATFKQTRKKSETDALDENSDLELSRDASDEESIVASSSKDTKKTPRMTRRKGTPHIFC